MAWTTSLGDDLEGVWRRMLAGEMGFVEMPSEHRVRNLRVAAVPTSGTSATRAHQRLRYLASQTLRRALRQGGLEASSPGLRLVLGTSLGAYLDEAEERTAPLDAWAQDVARELGASEPALCLSTACSSGADALLVGAELIRAGLAEVCVCGGVDVITESKRLAHSALTTMSPGLIRPFDQRHDGMLLGEGAGVLVLESPAHAARRGAPVLALLRGVGSANDAASMTSPDAEALGARLAIERSLADAGVAPAEVGLINAHGTATPVNDRVEGETFQAIFRGNAPIVFATKSNFGHSLGATGAIEAIAVVLALRDGRVPPIAGLEQPLPGFPFPLPVGRPQPHQARLGLSLTLGFGGFDTSLVIQAPE
ncbi:beta-ketoacyl-[acyl-carrier-protein] synthase family protein [Archangium violaceum]|nr:beta-ketoacyl-[acyl-carrier-protein] synthase family protein [Archangium violaceum]